MVKSEKNNDERTNIALPLLSNLWALSTPAFSALRAGTFQHLKGKFYIALMGNYHYIDDFSREPWLKNLKSMISNYYFFHFLSDNTMYFFFFFFFTLKI